MTFHTITWPINPECSFLLLDGPASSITHSHVCLVPELGPAHGEAAVLAHALAVRLGPEEVAPLDRLALARAHHVVLVFAEERAARAAAVPGDGCHRGRALEALALGRKGKAVVFSD